MKPFSVLDRTPNWDTLRNIDRPAISEPEFQGPGRASGPVLESPSTVETFNEFEGAWFPSTVDSTHIDLTEGSVNDGFTTFTPTVTGISVHASSLNYVYLECTVSVATTGGYVTGATITAAIVKAYTTTKTNTNTKAYLLLCTWQAGFTVARYRYYSHGYMAIDDGTNTGTAAHYFLGS